MLAKDFPITLGVNAYRRWGALKAPLDKAFYGHPLIYVRVWESAEPGAALVFGLNYTLVRPESWHIEWSPRGLLPFFDPDLLEQLKRWSEAPWIKCPGWWQKQDDVSKQRIIITADAMEQALNYEAASVVPRSTWGVTLQVEPSFLLLAGYVVSQDSLVARVVAPEDITFDAFASRADEAMRVCGSLDVSNSESIADINLEVREV